MGEKVPSEDSAIWGFHSMGLINNSCRIFRSAAIMRDLLKEGKVTPQSPAAAAEAQARMKRLSDIGIRTIICFEDPQASNDPAQGAVDGGDKEKADWIALERTAAREARIRWILFPIANDGPKSLETLSDDAVMKLLDEATSEILKNAQDGGVVFHCSAGHDRTGIVSAWMRMKYQRWPVEQAIAEMRRYGHNWVKYSHNGGRTSWHEDHLRAIAPRLANHDSAAK